LKKREKERGWRNCIKYL